jgi:glycosyltransferase involved in cell wall biosynthesis
VLISAAISSPEHLGLSEPPDADRLDYSALIAHDWLVSYGGSERVLRELRRLVPNSRLITTVNGDTALPVELKHSETTFLQRVPGAAGHYRWLLPLMPMAWRLADTATDVDVVISSSHSCAKAIRVAPGIPHVCYCHTPMRYAWEFGSERTRVVRPMRPLAAALMTGFRRWDRRTAQRVDHFVANSSAVAARIRRCYGREAAVIHPPVRTHFFTPGDERGDFFLYVGRMVGYKRADVVIEAFEGRPERLVVVGVDERLRLRLSRRASNIHFLPFVSDEHLRSLYRQARALVFVAEEDFGIAMAEAQACGTPVIALARGGALDIVIDRETGRLVKKQTSTAIREALNSFRDDDFNPTHIAHSAGRFSVSSFRYAFAELLRSAVGAPR